MPAHAIQSSSTAEPSVAIHISRDAHGLVARSEQALYADYVMRVSTRKGASGVLTTRATVHRKEGGFEVHRLYQDYSRCVFKTQHNRITEKIISEQQAQAIKVWDTLIAEATAHTKAQEGI